jgi:hypothetical protein
MLERFSDTVALHRRQAIETKVLSPSVSTTVIGTSSSGRVAAAN